jgi:type IV secretory pathway TrbL component
MICNSSPHRIAVTTCCHSQVQFLASVVVVGIGFLLFLLLGRALSSVTLPFRFSLVLIYWQRIEIDFTIL